MRLIDADVLMERIADISNPDMLTIGKVVGTIDTQPTAYDLDKVVEEIGANGKCIDPYAIGCSAKYCWDCEENVISIKKAIEIVKRGGKE